MGDRAYLGWAVFMASQILFSALLGIVLREWKGTSARTRMLLTVGLLLLLGSSVAAGYSGYARQTPATKEVARSANPCTLPPGTGSPC